MLIFSALNFIRDELEVYLSEKRANAEPLIVLSNPRSNNDSTKSSFLNSISLINIEEEKIFKSQVPKIIQNENGSYSKKEPDIKLNLYILISSYNKNYEDGLKFISKVVSYFQLNNVFQKEPETIKTHKELPQNIEKIIVELYTANFEQQNQIWGALSTGYLPSVIYKLRMLIIDSEARKEEYPPITEIKASY